MQKTHTPMPVRRNGFTLCELLWLVVCLGILIALISPSLFGVRGSHRSLRHIKCLGNLKNISVGLENYSAMWGGVIATGIPPEPGPRPGIDRGVRPEFSTSLEQVSGLQSNLLIDYGAMNRFWFLGLAEYVAQEESAKAIWDEAFFCPDDTLYSERAYEQRTNPDLTTIHQSSYLMSDTAFWAPEMFTDENIGQIMEADQLYENGVDRIATNGPATKATPGRRYMQTSQVKFPDKKVYVFEVNAFHEDSQLGYNTRGLKANVLFFDGHAALEQASSTEGQAGNLFIRMQCQMPWTDTAPDNNDPLWWYYSTTRDGIFGRDFIK